MACLFLQILFSKVTYLHLYITRASGAKSSILIFSNAFLPLLIRGLSGTILADKSLHFFPNSKTDVNSTEFAPAGFFQITGSYELIEDAFCQRTKFIFFCPFMQNQSENFCHTDICWKCVLTTKVSVLDNNRNGKLWSYLPNFQKCVFL